MELQLSTSTLTKPEIKTLAEKKVDELLENGGVLEFAEKCSAIESFIKDIRSDKRYVDYVREEAGKYPKGYASPLGTKIELAETGIDYDYSNCGDPVIAELLSQQEELKIKIKERQDFLKTVPISGLDTVLDGGEVVKLYPPSKKSTSSFKVTIKSK